MLGSQISWNMVPGGPIVGAFMPVRGQRYGRRMARSRVHLPLPPRPQKEKDPLPEPETAQLLIMKKGKIHSIESGGTKARVVPGDNSQIVTLPLIIPFYWRAEMGNVQIGDEVYYDEDPSLGGMIHGRTNGEWDNAFRGAFTITEDVTAGGISLKNHTHGGVEAGGSSTGQPE